MRNPRNIDGCGRRRPAAAAGTAPPEGFHVSVLSLPTPAAPVVAAPFAHGSRRLALPGRAADRATLAHHLAVVPLPARTFALVTGNAPGELPADAVLVKWVAVRTRAICGRLVAGETSSGPFRPEVAGLLSLGADPAPDGEQVLVGIAAAARRLAAWQLLPDASVAAYSSAIASLALPNVTEAGRRELDDAARGGFPAPLAALVEMLGVADAEDGAVKEAAQRLAPGSSRAGADALAGVVAVVRDVALGIG